MKQLDIRTQTLEISEGIRSELRIVELESDSVILCIPAMGVPAKAYDQLGIALGEAGISAVITELRGISSSSVRASRSCDFNYHDCVSMDLPAAVNVTAQLFPNKDIYLLGHSLGGQFAALFLSQNPNSAKGLILPASCTVYYKGWPSPGNLGLLFFTQVSYLISIILGYFPGKKLGFGGLEAKGVMRDWAINARSGQYKLSGTEINYEEDFSNINCPLLTINFEDDQFAPPKATNNLVAKFDEVERTQVFINAEQLKVKSADHFSWIKSPNKVVSEIQEWLMSKIPTS